MGHYEQEEIMTGANSSETVKVTESMFESETLNQAAGVSSDVTASTAHISPLHPDSSSKIINNAQSNIQCHSIGLTQGVEFSIDPKEKESSQTNANNASPEEGERGRKEESILESPTTESVPWSDTGISSLDFTGDKFSKGRRLNLELKDTTTDTDIEYSELSPSPMTQGKTMPGMSPAQSVTSDSPGKKHIEDKGLVGKADPYVRITLDKRKSRSPAVKNSLNPQWNFQEVFEVYHDSLNELLVEVFDEDIGKDDFLGKVSIDLSNIANNRLSNNIWVPLESCASGEILLSAQYIATNVPTSSTPLSETATKLFDDDRVISSSIETTAQSTPKKSTASKKFPGGTVNITVLRAKELKKKDIFSKSDPYAIISVGSQNHKTKTMKNTHEPEWNHEISITETRESGSEVKIHIFNKKSLAKDDSLGYMIFNTKEIFHHPKLINRWFKLEGTKSGQVLLAAEFISNDIDEKEIQLMKQPNPEAKYLNKQRGKLMLEFIKAKDLQKKGLFGKPDPYLEVKFGEEKFSSSVVKNDANPEWKFQAEFDVNSRSQSMLKINVFDEDFGTDDLLGTAEISVSDVSSNSLTTKWVTIESDKGGSIFISHRFIPIEMRGTKGGSPDETVIGDQNIDNMHDKKVLALQEDTTMAERVVIEKEKVTEATICELGDVESDLNIERTVNELLDENSRVMSIEI